MENKDFKNEKAAKYWLHYFRRDDVVQLSEKELEEESDLIFKSLMEGSQSAQPVKVKRLWYPMAAAVAAAILVFGAVILVNNNRTHEKSIEITTLQAAVNDVLPGKQGATLTLTNGKKIDLSNAANGQLADEAGVSIRKTANGQLEYIVSGTEQDPSKIGMTNTLSTANGQTYQVQLSDGTSVWLNAGSSVKFPATFSALKNREVELTGEAYFEVAKDKSHPFIVKTASQEVKVLGTHFNVNSYTNEGVVKTTLLEGSVVVSSLRGGTTKQSNFKIASTRSVSRNGVVLKPGEQLQASSTSIKVAKADLTESVAWKNGDFIFNKEDFGSILRQVARWYNVEIVDEKGHEGLQLTGTISRARNLSAVLKALESAGKVKFEISGKRVVVSQ